jgi:hypothetical protein
VNPPDNAPNGTLQQTEAVGGPVHSRDTGESGSLDGRQERPANPAGGGRMVDVLLQLTEDITNSGKRLVEVYSDRARHAVRTTAIRAGVATCALVCLLLWLGASTLALLRGLCAGLAALWNGSPWSGDLAGGLLGLALAALGIYGALRLSSRQELHKLRAKYEQLRKDHANTPKA